MKEACFLGVDVGTSGVKAVVVSSSGDVLASATTALRLATPRPGWAEQDPLDWWEATVASIRAVRSRSGAVPITAVGLSGQMHSSVFLDRAGDVVRPALLWCDGRTTEECREIENSVGGEARLRDLVSNPALEGFTLPKVLWLRNKEPEAFRLVATVMLAKDYVRYRLTGQLATEPSDASATLMYDPVRLRWSREILDALELNASLLPEVGASTDVLGHVNDDGAAASGLAVGTPVVGGGADNACGAAGVGVVAPGEAVASWGTSGTLLAPMSEARVDQDLRAHTFCHVVPDTWYLMGVALSAGGAFAWYRDQLARDLASDPDANRKLDDEAEAIPRGAEGVTFLPYLQGERTPHRNAAARGAFLGLSLAHTRAHMTRSVIEGVCFAFRDSLEILRGLGFSLNEVVFTGGGARSAFVRRTLAEVLGVSLAIVNREEGPAYGAALLAAVGAGAFPDLRTAAAATLRREMAEVPSAEVHRAYAAPYARFRASYRA